MKIYLTIVIILLISAQGKNLKRNAQFLQENETKNCSYEYLGNVSLSGEELYSHPHAYKAQEFCSQAENCFGVTFNQGKYRAMTEGQVENQESTNDKSWALKCGTNACDYVKNENKFMPYRLNKAELNNYGQGIESFEEAKALCDPIGQCVGVNHNRGRGKYFLAMSVKSLRNHNQRDFYAKEC